ncbi:MAG TPA: multiheme c-type cytochrome, partial [Candidatus Marinimicrobia bacterium]|nr:multiheme c-type cytochrome [Candidatus Neomarinimicrobiota bacterium]MDP7436824.1 multiheme c-type cytochrome [Candidatus Neomarinimicrobiota bacterium]HJL75311.1 multiheme c-type cytochrome [Candidatus Neomarinimicrobiota bacterium]HJM70644.1 multiheme c-type cytochrome [Candidatus Neomarinimicrobiota bacterium]
MEQNLCQREWLSFSRIPFSVFISFLLFVISCDDQGREDPIPQRPVQTTFKVEDFSSAEDCQDCHPNHYEEWSASMHAYSVTDPVWFKLQQNEQITHEAKGVVLGDFCIQCHSPIASLTNAITDHKNLTQETMNTLPIQIREGVTCDVCHTLTHLPESTDI